MISTTVHTPYDSSSRPFTIGLSKLDLHDWIEVDDHLRAYLDEKDRLAATVPERIFVAEPGSETSQAEVLSLLAQHLPARFPGIYQHFGTHIDIVPAFRRVVLDTPLPPLLTAAGLVQEDLILMRKGEDGWRLGAGSLAFPSAWRLLEKFGKPMHEIHAPVPGFSQGTRNADLIARMFDNLSPANPVLRWNWGIYEDAELYHPGSGNGMRRFGETVDAAGIFIRVERQTLRKLPVSGDILFTIRIHLNPLSLLAQQPNRQELARGLATQIAALSDAELTYKSLSDERGRLLEQLALIAAG